MYEERVLGSAMIRLLYAQSKAANLLLKHIVSSKVISVIYGHLMNSSFSRLLIRNFVKNNNINLNDSEKSIKQFKNFNDFFTRRLKQGSREINLDNDTIISPADGKILVYENYQNSPNLYIKGSDYNLYTLLQDKQLAGLFENCSIAVIRLSPIDYHRFHFPLDGFVSDTKYINGKYYSVSPIALLGKPELYYENKRTITEFEHQKIGKLLFLEIGATLVGSIKQTHLPHSEVKKAEEKGYFEFGGSTVILIFQKDKILFDSDILENTNKGCETVIRMGESLGKII